MGAARVKVLLVMLVAVAAVSFGEALLARGMKHTATAGPAILAQARALAGSADVVGGTLLMAVYFGLYMYALRLADLSFVLPVTALSYLLGACLARTLLHEHVTGVRWIGAFIITVGVAVVGLGDRAPVRTP